MMLRQLVACAAIVGATGAVAVAQEPVRPLVQQQRSQATPPKIPILPPQPEEWTPEQRAEYEAYLARGLPEDATYEEFLEKWLTPMPYPARTVVKLDETYARPHVAVRWEMEIVREEGDTIWLRGIPPENPRSPIHRQWMMRQLQEAAYLRNIEVVEREYYLDFEEVIVPPPSVDVLTLREARSERLPDGGLWQMNVAVADVDLDGQLDLVLPPSRKGTARPLVFRGDGRGGFSYWPTSWHPDIPMDYGAVAVADFDGDGHSDVVLARHFGGQFLFYGDGQGRFLRAEQLPSPNPVLTSRAVTTADFDGDGDQDLAFMAEINYDPATNEKVDASTVWVLLRDEKGWTVVTEGLPPRVFADSIAAADVDSDGRPDLILGSNLSDWRSMVAFNTTSGWSMMTNGPGVLSDAFHFDVAPGAPIAEGTELFAVFLQFREVGGEKRARTGVVRYSVEDGAITRKGTVLAMDDDRTNPYWRIATGDLDGDGRLDLVVGRKDGGLELYRRSADGTFARERSPELGGSGRPYGLELSDLDGDGRADIVATFADRPERPGGVQVWLSGSGS